MVSNKSLGICIDASRFTPNNNFNKDKYTKSITTYNVLVLCPVAGFEKQEMLCITMDPHRQGVKQIHLQLDSSNLSTPQKIFLLGRKYEIQLKNARQSLTNNHCEFRNKD